jgi:hypothetical protein
LRSMTGCCLSSRTAARGGAMIQRLSVIGMLT